MKVICGEGLGSALQTFCSMDAVVEPTWTKLQEQVLNSEAARRGKYKDVFYTYLRRVAQG